DYIAMEDSIDYVDIFYTQLQESRNIVKTDEDENNHQELLEVLDRIEIGFVDMMAELFKVKLMLTIQEIDSEDRDYNEIEIILRELYEFFILGAKKNFTQVIAYDVIKRLGDTVITDDREYFNRVQNMMVYYSPLFTEMGPTEFLKSLKADTIIQLFDGLKVTGNFLRKYSPRFYRNEEFQVEVINEATLLYGFRGDVKKVMDGKAPPEITSEEDNHGEV
ncbi:MAG: hypothetical protein K2N48_02320, partial [Muribaculaceae bacterium]|nr:hypothetical protein [Muribaculaceae bacterium]